MSQASAVHVAVSSLLCESPPRLVRRIDPGPTSPGRRADCAVYDPTAARMQKLSPQCTPLRRKSPLHSPSDAVRPPLLSPPSVQPATPEKIKDLIPPDVLEDTFGVVEDQKGPCDRVEQDSAFFHCDLCNKDKPGRFRGITTGAIVAFALTIGRFTNALRRTNIQVCNACYGYTRPSGLCGQLVLACEAIVIRWNVASLDSRTPLRINRSEFILLGKQFSTNRAPAQALLRNLAPNPHLCILPAFVGDEVAVSMQPGDNYHTSGAVVYEVNRDGFVLLNDHGRKIKVHHTRIYKTDDISSAYVAVRAAEQELAVKRLSSKVSRVEKERAVVQEQLAQQIHDGIEVVLPYFLITNVLAITLCDSLRQRQSSNMI
jgi:hypothetical protein